ncbi:MAG: NAD(+) kinase [Methanocalculus sp. MSAO_Arc2]|uniref:NAD(+)/NADH kinase n=1 Tax=Methanocalculus sp. MSAO_Arc2 TaxID=2293855 RepID=UPI000FF14569|nr:MAG: NAD(+) kinase [Methanocalculus sp. MSAO_Arc2]
MRFFIVSRIDRSDAVAFAGKLAEDLTRVGHIALLEEETAEILGKEGVSLDEAARDTDCIAVVGGDGTVLRVVLQMAHQAPILGINWGEVGFLADLEPDDAYSFLTAMQPGFTVEKRMRLLFQTDNGAIGNALNEALIVTSRPAKMLRFRIVIDGLVAETFRADGIIISTPTGSTAYAMSAGGPIVDPWIDGVLIVPLAPYMLSSRPHLISADRKIEIRLESDKPANLVIDGVMTRPLGLSASIDVTRSQQPALFVTAGQNFFEKVEQKLRRL